jgi:signal transduction histidine kinase
MKLLKLFTLAILFLVSITTVEANQFNQAFLIPEIFQTSSTGLALQDLIFSIFTLTFLLFVYFFRHELSGGTFLSHRIVPLGLTLIVHLFFNSFYLYQKFPNFFNTWLKLHVLTTALSVSFIIAMASFTLLNRKLNCKKINIIIGFAVFLVPSFRHELQASHLIISFLIPITLISTSFAFYIFYQLIKTKRISHSYAPPLISVLILIFILASYDTYNLYLGNSIQMLFSGIGFLLFYVLCVMVIIIKNKQIKIVDLELSEALANQAEQVAHDIRSPLAALNVAIKDIQFAKHDNYEMMRSAVNRIHNIANELLVKDSNLDDNLPIQKEPILLSSLLESIITEKRLQYRNRNSVDLILSPSENSYGLFSYVSPNEFKRVLSNLINNSYDSISSAGNITVEVDRNEQHIIVRILDSGIGITPDKIEHIFEKNVSNKKEGSGLGLFHARNSIESWGGTISVESNLEMGTLFEIKLIPASHPSWFIPELQLVQNKILVIVDDDISIHQMWKGRINSSLSNEQVPEIVNFLDPAKFEEWFLENPSKYLQVLMDLEFVGNSKNGLNLIKDNKLEPFSILVTSRFEESWVQKECSKNNLRLLPKALTSYIPITMDNGKNNLKDNQIALLLDDDPLIQQLWQLKAKKAQINLVCFQTENEILRAINSYSKDINIYLDYELGPNQLTGVEVAEKLHNLGYLNLYLTTGHEPKKFKEYPFFKDIISKEAPFS